ncbi:hypothetical protein [Actinomadura keratinilytica]|jgi:hypothetical protein|uniref:Uncharacterized protein n=1 Tax=Actinomadura keratinilytica TaxID=547461 RepID=A0ABP7YLK4_9ACTN
MTERRNAAEDSRPLADRRAEAGAPQEEDHDFGDEHTASSTKPPIAEAETPGGEDEGYSPQTEIP